MTASGTEFNIQEGAHSTFQLTLAVGEVVKWSVVVDYGYDIDFSIRAISRSNGSKGTWILLQPDRVMNRDGYIDGADLSDDGIHLPATIEFVMDNTYSWFNAKHVILSASTMPAAIGSRVSSPVLPDHRRSQSPAIVSPSKELLRLQESRAKIDLLWINQVVSEAILRCPEVNVEVKNSLEETKRLLKPHVDDISQQAII